MIYTVTFNPSLDYIVGVENFRAGEINRTSSEKLLPGGKGLNVSMVLSNLGHNSVALGFLAGFTGREIESRMREFGCMTDFIHVQEGFSRINCKIMSDQETAVNGQGPKISRKDIEVLGRKLDKLQSGDILVISGSIPNTLPENMYERILCRLDGRGIETVVDAEGSLLTNVLKYHPFLIKPNHHELGAIFGVTLKTHEEVIPWAKLLQEQGARNVLVSMGSRIKAVNTVGAADSMVAGFIACYVESGDFEKAFRLGQAAGSASAASVELATGEEVRRLVSAGE